MKVFIKRHENNAGKWIYNGYFNAWAALGYEAFFYDDIKELSNEKDFFLMTLDSCVTKENISILENAKKVFLFVQPTFFEQPWGSHPNFISSIDHSLINRINNNVNIIKWSFAENSKYFKAWEQIKTMPLAFDDIVYANPNYKENFNFDVCFIGGRANNGFDEKYKIMLDVFAEFKKTNFKCGFFIDKNLTLEQERDILFSSKICLNIHDAYQRKLGLDTNERSFKSLGINGMMVSDDILQLKNIFSFVETARDSSEYIKICSELLEGTSQKIQRQKENNKEYVLKNHTYKSRIMEFLKY